MTAVTITRAVLVEGGACRAELRRRNHIARAEALAAIALPDPTPLAQLAHALGCSLARLSEACAVADCAVMRTATITEAEAT